MRLLTGAGIVGVLMGTLAPTAAHAQAPDVPACGVQLRIHLTSPSVVPTGSAVFFDRLLVAQLVNVSADTVRLVMPGDGSAVGWRTPTLRWRVTAATGYSPPVVGRCGNINPLQKGEVFDLAPGETKPLNGWVPEIYGVGPGTYRLRLSYSNEPTLQWRGLELAPHDAAEMARVRASTPCRVESNEISLTVQPAPQ